MKWDPGVFGIVASGRGMVGICQVGRNCTNTSWVGDNEYEIFTK